MYLWQKYKPCFGIGNEVCLTVYVFFLSNTASQRVWCIHIGDIKNRRPFFCLYSITGIVRTLMSAQSYKVLMWSTLYDL